MQKPGGKSQIKEADEEIQNICDQVKSEIESKNSKTYSKFKAVSYSHQVVAGINYFINVDVGDENIIQIKVFKDLKGKLNV